jgi:hypothetical protein
VVLIVAGAVDGARRDPSWTIKEIRTLLEVLGLEAESHWRRSAALTRLSGMWSLEAWNI